MKNILITLAIVAIVGVGLYFILNNDPTPINTDNENDLINTEFDEDQDSGLPSANDDFSSTTEVTLDGEVLSVNLEQMAVDGPGLITFIVTSGETYTVAVPSMGINLCDAVDNIENVSEIAVGDNIAVRGEMQWQGNIVPCEKPDHYLRITS